MLFVLRHTSLERKNEILKSFLADLHVPFYGVAIEIFYHINSVQSITVTSIEIAG